MAKKSQAQALSDEPGPWDGLRVQGCVGDFTRYLNPPKSHLSRALYYDFHKLKVLTHVGGLGSRSGLRVQEF